MKEKIKSILLILIQLKNRVLLYQLNKIKGIDMNDKIYTTAKSLLGRRLTLDVTVPPDLGCAEAISYVLRNAGIEGIPQKGFAGTSQLYDFLLRSVQFIEVEISETGCIQIYVSGTSSIGSPHGHVFVVGKNSLMSNDSNSGLFLALWTAEAAARYYEGKLGFAPHFFKAL